MHIVLFHFYSKKPNPVYQEISAALRQLGHTVWVAEPDLNDNQLLWKDGDDVIERTPGPAEDQGLLSRLPILSGLGRRWAYFQFLSRVKAVLRRHQPDIVQVNPPLLAWWLPLFMPMRFYLDIRQINEAVDERLKTRIRERMGVWGMQMNARYVYPHTFFCHAGAAERILGAGWRRKGSVVPVGVDDQFNRFEHQTAVDAAAETVRFVYIGTLSRLRSLERLIEAAKLLTAETTAFQLDLIGPDTSGGYYQQVIEQLGVTAVTAVLPPVPYEQVPEVLGLYDVGLAYVPDRPTWHYQPTIKVLEYRAMGLPILSTDVASHREVVETGVNGLLCADTPQAIADSMASLIKERERLVKMKTAARQMRRGNTWQMIAEQYEAVYQRFAGQWLPTSSSESAVSQHPAPK